MNRFATLYRRLDETNRGSEKLAALTAYLRNTPPTDAAWAVWFLSGKRVKRVVSYPELRGLVAERSGFPDWMVSACYEQVGDLSETLSLLVGASAAPDADASGPAADAPEGDGGVPPLAELVERYLQPLPRCSAEQRRAILYELWDRLDPWQVFVFHKLVSGSFRVGVAKTTLVKALAEVAGVDDPTMAHRLSGGFEPTAEGYAALIQGEPTEADASAPRPYPFCLAVPLLPAGEVRVDMRAELGDRADWLAEWKWDGIRAQLIRRAGAVHVWSRGEKLVSESFPEVVSMGRRLPEDTVIDGEVLAWDEAGGGLPAGSACIEPAAGRLEGRPLPFGELQRRLGRKDVRPMLFQPDVPVTFLAYDLLEREGADLRARPMRERRDLLAELCESAGIAMSPQAAGRTWEELASARSRSRELGTEGLMLKRWDSAYGVGRRKGDWFKWKIDPYLADLVMVAAERGHGERASIFSDYTFAAWDREPETAPMGLSDPGGADGRRLVTVTRAYSGLTNEEMHRVDRWVRGHTTRRAGPVHLVEPMLLFEIAFEGIQESPRHQSGLALRFPRMNRWREDKPIEQADTLPGLRALLGRCGPDAGTL